jgi:hypothetical protein
VSARKNTTAREVIVRGLGICRQERAGGDQAQAKGQGERGSLPGSARGGKGVLHNYASLYTSFVVPGKANVSAMECLSGELDLNKVGSLMVQML